ncbi:MAG: hypothetical protein KatS3mg009_2575 [Acidimicrobiia bacterium]|nr:MAG: hypothetical protein KatS3mg009_2575 [Acidimicrobiia bacterium]
MIRAGLPTTLAWAGTSAVTTAPAPTIAPVPMRTPGRSVALAPIDAPSSTTVVANRSGRRLLRGNRSFVKVAFGPMKTSSPMRTPSQSCTPLLIVTRSPTTTSFSTNTPKQTLQSAPITAPGRTCAKAQTRVPGPIEGDSQIACGCTNAPSVTGAPRGTLGPPAR